MWLAAATLWQREVIRFLRQRSRLVGALATPVVFWLLLGSGLGRSFRTTGLPEEHGYLQYFFPGTLAMILLFSAIFSTISVIEDRAAGFLQGVLVAPISRAALVLGNVLGGTTLAMLQAVILLLAAPLVGFHLSASAWITTIGVMAVLAFALTCLGFLVAWRLNSTQGFHAIMNLVLIPMWMLSGAVFPLDGAPVWLRAVMRINPVTYGVAAIRRCLSPAGALVGDGLPSAPICLAIVAVFGLVLFAICVRSAVRYEVAV
jgi:ABC-2 type transport system permease protein